MKLGAGSAGSEASPPAVAIRIPWKRFRKWMGERCHRPALHPVHPCSTPERGPGSSPGLCAQPVVTVRLLCCVGQAGNTSDIPQLQADGRVLDGDLLQCEIHANGRLVVVREDVVNVPAVFRSEQPGITRRRGCAAQAQKCMGRTS